MKRFTPESRGQIRDALLSKARQDPKVIAAAITGSAATGAEDEWSDIDLIFGLEESASLQDVVEEWTTWIYEKLGALHHWDLWFSRTLYRVWLLPDTLEIDIAFAPRDEFGSRGPGFTSVFGDAGPVFPESPGLDVNHTIGLSWHHLLHIRSCIGRGKLWQAEYWLSEVRNYAMTLACERHALPVSYFRGVDNLPPELLRKFEEALSESLEANELSRALTAVTQLFIDEIEAAQPDLAERLRGPLLQISSDTRAG